MCACTHMAHVASKTSGGDKRHWGSQQPSWLRDPGIQQVEVGVLAGINQSWCVHVQSSSEAQVREKEGVCILVKEDDFPQK